MANSPATTISHIDAQIRLEDQLHDAITKSPYLTRRTVSCEEKQGRVILRGQVGTYFQKQMATEILRGIAGVEQIENQLEVVWR